jgi:alpha-methylacyl-CoA racemase
MPQPLSGIRIVDLTNLLPGPLATLMLAEAGAEVIKIERPGGDDMRGYAPQWQGTGAAFSLLNRGKKTLTLDLKTEGGNAQLRALLESADILVEQFRPNIMEKLGFDYEAVRAINPRLIYCSISGYGQTGPRASEAGHDLNYIASTGLLGRPARAGCRYCGRDLSGRDQHPAGAAPA